MSSSEYERTGRKSRNETSKVWAHRDGEVWTKAEDEVLVDYWIYKENRTTEDEVDISKLLERTIEACRVRCERLRSDLGIQSFRITRTETITLESKPYLGLEDSPEDVYWR